MQTWKHKKLTAAESETRMQTSQANTANLSLISLHNSLVNRKLPKNSDTRKFAVIILKVEQGGCTLGVMRPNDAEGIANRVDPDQTALIWVCTVCPSLSVRKLRIIMVLSAEGHDCDLFMLKVRSAPSEDSDQPGHLPSLIRVFAVRSTGS